MNWFIVLAYVWIGLGILLVFRAIWLFERKRDTRPVKFMLATCPERYKFTAFTAIGMALAGYFGAQLLVPLLAANFVVGWIQRTFVGRWIRKGLIGVPMNYKRHL